MNRRRKFDSPTRVVISVDYEVLHFMKSFIVMFHGEIHSSVLYLIRALDLSNMQMI
jgi:hypothetical protein